ncbi:MAG TPA: cytochrome bd-I oxidase subunit CydX [Gammaproteobacteria bacterium]|nr:cytochrome bd-I oxidase subunit CydX [Gammaproteobacteria bacterium]
MWYFTWILGLGLAVSFGIINALWLEAQCGDDEPKDNNTENIHTRGI